MMLVNELEALLLRSSLAKSWDTLIVTLSSSTLEGKFTMGNVIDSFLNEEVRRKERGLSLIHI